MFVDNKGERSTESWHISPDETHMIIKLLFDMWMWQWFTFYYIITHCTITEMKQYFLASNLLTVIFSAWFSILNTRPNERCITVFTIITYFFIVHFFMQCFPRLCSRSCTFILYTTPLNSLISSLNLNHHWWQRTGESAATNGVSKTEYVSQTDSLLHTIRTLNSFFFSKYELSF